MRVVICFLTVDARESDYVWINSSFVWAFIWNQEFVLGFLDTGMYRHGSNGARG